MNNDDRKAALAAALAAGNKPALQTLEGAEHAKGGRPRVPKEKKIASNRITIYVSDEDYALLTKKAEDNGMSQGAFVKWATFQFLKGADS